jgi:4-carboxymuconolactone decarboxylase
MARIQLIQQDQAAPDVKEIYDRIEKNGARIINLYKALAHNSRVLQNHLQLGNALLSRTKLSPKLRELAILRIAKLTRSNYEWAQHYPVALETGVSKAQAGAVSSWQDSALFSDEERAVLRYTDEVSQQVGVTNDTFTTLKQYLDEQCIVELTVAIGYWGMVARVLVPLQVDMDTQSVGSASELTGRKTEHTGNG